MNEEKGQLKISVKLREILEERIVTGHYRPGTRLDETELACEFSASRTPVREALIQLSSAGLIDIRPRRGAVVAEASHSRIYEMFEVMAELEAMSVRMAVRRHNEEDLRRIESSLKACKIALDQCDLDAYYHENAHFHRALYAASHNQFLYEKVCELSKRLSPYRRLQLRVRGRIQISCDEHTRIAKAIGEGNAELTVKLIRKHVVVQGENFADLMASLNQPDRVA